MMGSAIWGNRRQELGKGGGNLRLFVLFGVLSLAAVLWSQSASAACIILGDCSCSGFTLNNVFGMPNGSNATATCFMTCSDSDGSCSDGSWSGCSITLQTSQTTGWVTVPTGPIEGTNTAPIFCGGQSCTKTMTKQEAFNRNISFVRTNTTGSWAALRCNFLVPGGPSTPLARAYIYSPGNPNITNNLTWRDAGGNLNNTNASSRLLGNLTVFDWFPVSDGSLTNTSLWANFSANGSNSSTFRLIGTNKSCVANQTCSLAINVTDPGNFSWFALVANNYSSQDVLRTGGITMGTGATAKWNRNLSMFPANLSDQKIEGKTVWFNASFYSVPAADPCAPAGTWTVTTTITCTNVNITVDTLNVTETGSLTLINVTLRSGNVYVTDSGPLGGKGRLSYENTTYDGSQAWWLNGNLTVGGRVNISGVKLYLNGTADGSAGINVTNTGYLFVRGNSTNITAGETTSNGYFFWNDYGSNLSIQDAAISYAGASQGRYQRGIVINTTAANMTRLKVYDGYEGLTLLDWSNGTNASRLDIQRITGSGITVRYAKDVNVSVLNNSGGGGGFSIIGDGMVIEHGNVSSNTGEGVGGNGVQNLTLIDVNISGGSQSAIGIANIKNLTLVSVNITNNAWHGVSGYTMNGVWLHEVNTSGNLQSDIGINYDQLAAKTTSKSNYVHAYNSTVSGTIAFQGSVNLTAWNTTTNSVTYGTCTICNLTVRWPVALSFINGTGDAVEDAAINLYSQDQSYNHSNRTGSGGHIRYLNLTEYGRTAATTYLWTTNYTVNASKHYYANRSQSLNFSGPNETTMTMTYTQCNPVPGTAWNITQNLTCANTSISVSSTNITQTGSLFAEGVNLSTRNMTVESTATNNTFANQTLWVNQNLTIEGFWRFENSIIMMNGSGFGVAVINVTPTGTLLLNKTNVTRLPTPEGFPPGEGAYPYEFFAHAGSTVWATNSEIRLAGWEDAPYQRGVEFNSSSLNLTNTLFVGNTVGFHLHGAASNASLSNFSILGGTYGVRLQNASNINLSDFYVSGGTSGIVRVTTSANIGLVRAHLNLDDEGQAALYLDETQRVNLSHANLTGISARGLIYCDACGNVTVMNVNGSASIGSFFNAKKTTSGPAGDIRIVAVNVTVGNAGLLLEDPFSRIYVINTAIAAGDTFISGNPTLTAPLPHVYLLNTTSNNSILNISSKINVSVQWPLSVLVNDSTTNASLSDARLSLYAAGDLTENLTNTTGTSGYIRHLNVTEYWAWNTTGRRYLVNYTLNVSKAGYGNASVSLNISGPNETFVALFPQCTPPNQTHRDWRIDLSDNCDVRHKNVNLGRGNLTFFTEQSYPGFEGNATFTDVNLTAMRWLDETRGIRKNITVQEGKGQQIWTFQTA